MNIPLDIIKQPEEKKVDNPFFACVYCDNKLYFSSWLINGLCSIELTSGKITYHRRFDNECEEQHLHIKAVKYENEIWFIPYKGNYISIVNIDTEEIKSIEIPKSGESRYKFWTAIVTQSKFLWLIPWEYKDILKFNMETRSICAIEDNPMNYINKMGEVCFIDAVNVENTIWLFPQEAKEIYIYDMIDEKTRKIPWIHGKDVVNRMVYTGDAVWFFPTIKSSLIIKKNILTEEEIYYTLPKESLEKISERCYAAEFIGDWIWMAPFEGRNFIRINIHTGDIQEVTELHRKACLSELPYERFQISYKTEECLLFLSDGRGTAMFIYYKNSGQVKLYELSISWEEYSKYLIIKANGLLDEKTIQLSDFVEGVLQKNTLKNDSSGSNLANNAGKRIWSRVQEIE